MRQQTIVGLYPTRGLAEDVRRKLQAEGIAESDISLAADQGGVSVRANPPAPKHEESFWDWLFGSEVSAEERERYSGHLRSGNVAVSVRARSEAEHDKIIAVMEQFDPLDLDGDDAQTAMPKTSIAGDLSGAAQSLTGSAAFAAAERRASGSAGPTATDGDQVIPLGKEELEVGKRQVEHRHRVRTHVIERPVEEQVTLRDETVAVERRPATAASPVGADAFKEREFEVVERDEEAVVSKQARVAEEVVVRKDATERVETVRDTMRETKVDVDRDGTGIDRAAAGSKPTASTFGTTGTVVHGDGRSVGERIADKAPDLTEDDKDALKK